jgi:hypothetical protein
MAGGVNTLDILTYAAPLGFIGRMANSMFIEKEIRKIFQFRSEKIKELFPNTR